MCTLQNQNILQIVNVPSKGRGGKGFTFPGLVFLAVNDEKPDKPLYITYPFRSAKKVVKAIESFIDKNYNFSA